MQQRAARIMVRDYSRESSIKITDLHVREEDSSRPTGPHSTEFWKCHLTCMMSSSCNKILGSQQVGWQPQSSVYSLKPRLVDNPCIKVWSIAW